MLTDVDKKLQKNANRFVCLFCDYNGSNKYNYDKHVLTPKHLKNCKLLTNVDTDVDKNQEKVGVILRSFNFLFREKILLAVSELYFYFYFLYFIFLSMTSIILIV